MGKEMDEELFYRIALTQTDLIGPRQAKQLLQHFGTAKSIFNACSGQLSALGGVGSKKVAALRAEINKKLIYKELMFLRKHDIQPLFITDEGYPQKLLMCPDAPVLLYYKGTADLNSPRMIAIVGTRKPTDYGLRITEELIEGLSGEEVIIVSGLAYGIDIHAHQRAVQSRLPTIGVMAHGMNMIYPSQHGNTAKEMIRHGGLLTEYISDTAPDRFHFPMRNRIVAGMCDATVVIETEVKGGAMITAKLAAGYNREVAAVPGRTIDRKSEGCNYLIHTQIAQMVTCPNDLLDMMGWIKGKGRVEALQPRLFYHLTDGEHAIAHLLDKAEGMHFDEMVLKSHIADGRLSSMLLTMEMNGIVRSLPGKRYCLA